MADELVERLVRELAALRARVAALERQEGLTSPVGTSQIADGAVTAAKIAGGPGSGVHADLLDNQHLSDLDSRYVNASGDTMTGALVVDRDVGPGGSRIYYNLASYKSYGNPDIGTMKITLPKSWSNTMMRIRIAGYDYSSNAGWEATISGYNYEPDQVWARTAAELRGNTPFSTVRLAHDGTKNCILLGNTTTEWRYPHVAVLEMLASYQSITGWETGWNIGIITDESGITKINTPPLRKFWHSGNDGSGSGLDADKLDGLEASAIRGVGAIVKRTTTQTISNDTVTAVSFDTELADIGDCFNPNQPDRITAPADGVYLIWGQIRWATGNNTGVRIVYIYLQGTLIATNALQAQGISGISLQVTALRQLSANQYVQLTVYQNSGGALNIEPYNNELVGFGMFRLY